MRKTSIVMTKENPSQSISITSLLSFNKMGRHTGSTTKPWSSTCAVPLNCGLFVLVSILISWKFGDRFKKRLFFLIWVAPTMKSSPSRLCRCKEWGVILFPLPQGGFPFDCLSLLLAWYYYWHGVLPFIIHFFMLQYSLGIAITDRVHSCPVVYARLIWGWLISPSTPCSELTCRADEVTYSHMIDIFISGWAML